MRIPSQAHFAHPWRVHTLTPDFELIDAWRFDVRLDQHLPGAHRRRRAPLASVATCCASPHAAHHGHLSVYAHRTDTPFHAAAKRCLAEQIEGRATWAIPWPCVHEFLAVVTKPRVFDPPTPLARALGQVDVWLASPSLVLLAESSEHWTELRRVVATGRVVGAQIHDARIAALCRLHGVRELWTADRDFTRFAGVVVRNPLVVDRVREPPPRYRRRRRATAAV